jgi:hypothetical protein
VKAEKANCLYLAKEMKKKIFTYWERTDSSQTIT